MKLHKALDSLLLSLDYLAFFVLAAVDPSKERRVLVKHMITKNVQTRKDYSKQHSAVAGINTITYSAVAGINTITYSIIVQLIGLVLLSVSISYPDYTVCHYSAFFIFNNTLHILSLLSHQCKQKNG